MNRIKNQEVINRMHNLEKAEEVGRRLSRNQEGQLRAGGRYSDEDYNYDTYRERRNDEVRVLFGDVQGLKWGR